MTSFPLETPGLWVERRSGAPGAGPLRPALFLDRDGVVNEDSGYIDDPARVVLLPWAVRLIAEANSAGWPVVVVTNQSGIARGMFGWDAFARVQDRIHAGLAAAGARIDAVIACAYHESGSGALGIADHPMRKPNPGMLLRAATLLPVALDRSILIGDKPADLVAAARAGLRRAWLVDPGAGGEALLDEAAEARGVARLLDRDGARARRAIRRGARTSRPSPGRENLKA